MKILYFSPIPYSDLKQRPQYIAEGLAKTHEVLYVEPTVSIMKYLLKGGENPSGRLQKISQGLSVLRLDGHRTAHRSLETISKLFCASEHRQIKKYLDWADLVWIGYAPWYNMVCKFSGKLVYDKMDENRLITTNPLTRRLIEEVEPSLIERADAVFVTAQSFYNDIAEEKDKCFIVRNAVDSSQLSSVGSISTKEKDFDTFGYVGMISHWFDLDAIKTILDSGEKNRVILVGPTEIPKLNHPRLRYIGRVSKSEVPRWIASFDVCLYPFKRNELADTINPVKLYEYLAQNKPVLAVRSSEVEAIPAKVCSYADLDELRGILRDNKSSRLDEPFSTDNEREEFVKENNWDARVEYIRSILEEI